MTTSGPTDYDSTPYAIEIPSGGAHALEIALNFS
jgi:hypothetical protein